jgi:GDP-4-dehydro-6-deoxy-D-mannose reductase
VATPEVALVTGAAGFVGRWLAAALLGAEARVGGPAPGAWRVVGAAQTAPDLAALDASRTSARADLAPVTLADVDWRVGDLTRPGALEAIVTDVRPSLIVHLAAMSFVPQAAADPAGAVAANVGLTAALLGAVTRAVATGQADPLVVVVGSAEQYGRHEPPGAPIPETAPQSPRTVYGATKSAAEMLALQAARTGTARVLVVRPFNHAGPGQDPRFFLPATARRIAALAAVPPADRALAIGNTDTVRDLLHVRDVVAAYIALARHGVPGEAYNVASGTGHTIGALAERLLQRAGVEAPLRQDPALVRPAEVPALVGDARKLRVATGWAPRLTLDDLLDDLLHAAPR